VHSAAITAITAITTGEYGTDMRRQVLGVWTQLSNVLWCIRRPSKAGNIRMRQYLHRMLRQIAGMPAASVKVDSLLVSSCTHPSEARVFIKIKYLNYPCKMHFPTGTDNGNICVLCIDDPRLSHRVTRFPLQPHRL